MTVYSHSRLSTYEQCPQKFKLQYIDKVKTEIEQSVEAFLGSRTHEVLEKHYRDLQHFKENTLDELLKYLHDEWEKNWTDSIVIVKKDYGKENYFKMAEKFITDYYNRYKPFNQGKIIGIEERIMVNLDDSGEYKLQGFIDRLTETDDGCYQIHDYKTNSRLPLPQYLDNDRQLALYALGVKDKYPDVRDIRLIWHFLAFDKELDSTRTDEELENLKQETIQLIDKIEDANEYPANPSLLCDWCEFKPICRQWSHLYVLEGKPANEYLNDDGVKLVNRYAELLDQKKQIKLDLYAEIEKIEEAITKFAEKEGVDVVFGSNNKVRIAISERYSFPPKNSKEREQIEQLLKDTGNWDAVTQLDTSVINKMMLEKKLNKELLHLLNDFVKLESSKRLYLSKKKE